MSWLPQDILIFVYVLNLGCTAALDGQPRTGKISFTSTFIATACIFLLLFWGGFFTHN
jgi:hypothetical protein